MAGSFHDVTIPVTIALSTTASADPPPDMDVAGGHSAGGDMYVLPVTVILPNAAALLGRLAGRTLVDADAPSKPAGDANPQARRAVTRQDVRQRRDLPIDRTLRADRAARAATDAPALRFDIDTKQNEDDLARVIESEAGGVGLLAEEAVGSTLLNRMRRSGSMSGSMSVRGNWRGFTHKKSPSKLSQKLAEQLLTGAIRDPTHGATNFYTPSAMASPDPIPGRTHQGKNPSEDDGEIEMVPGDQYRNYRPPWSTQPDMTRIEIPDIPESAFKFYRKKGDGPVR